MSYFKILSDDPADYEEQEELQPAPKLDNKNLGSLYMQQSTIENHIDLILDTGEQFTIPLNWLINAARHLKFDLNHNGTLH